MKKKFVIVFLGLIALMIFLSSCAKKECADEQTIQKLDIEIAQEKVRFDSLTKVAVHISSVYPDSVNAGLNSNMLNSALKSSDLTATETQIRKTSKCL